MNQHVKNQHTVPQFILKHFSNTNQTYIWSFDKSAIEERWNNKKNRAIKNTPTEEYFYDKLIGEKSQSLEYVLAEKESNSEPVITKLIQTRNLNQLTNQDRNLISEFISYQILRTKQSFFNTSRMLNDLISPLEELSNNQISINDRKLWLDRLKMANNYKSYLLNKTWILAESDEQFFTSDNPVVFQNSTSKQTLRGNLGLESKGIEIYFPLSSSLILCMFCEQTVTQSIPNIQTEPAFIKNLNWLQIAQSVRFIFSKSGDFSLIEQMIKEKDM